MKGKGTYSKVSASKSSRRKIPSQRDVVKKRPLKTLVMGVESELIGTLTDAENKFNFDELTLVTHSDAQDIKDYLGNHDEINDFSGFFVGTRSGEYYPLLAYYDSLPRSSSKIYEITYGLF